MDIEAWLRSLGLSRYESAFRDNSIDADVLPDLTDGDLAQLGVNLGDRKRLLKAIASLGATGLAAKPTRPGPLSSSTDAAERRPITVMFCDLVGSTSLAAKLDAEDWRNLVGAYLDEASQAVTGFGGHVLKRLGDGLMALFGYPKAQENDAERAVRAALAIQRALAELNARNAGTRAPQLIARIGLESGPVVVDATGEVFGEAPNVAARVGNKLSTGEIRTSEGVRVDLRNIKAPIVCFCSWGDNITPPQQALDWVLDLYDDVSEIVTNGQTIIYSLHHSIGHLGIFVSGKVAAKEHREFVSCMEMIEATPPGLYEAVISDVGEDTANRDLVDGKYLFRLEPRTLDDIRAFGVNSPDDDKRFATVARLSEINVGLYRTFAEPWVRASVTEPMAEAMRAMHPNRLRFGLFSDRNPFMSAIKPMAEQVRANRKPVSGDSPLLAMEKQASSWITSTLESWGEIRDTMIEAYFLTTYGSPILQAMVGLGSPSDQTPHRIERDLVREAAAAELRSGLDRKFEEGGVEEAVLRALVYVRRPEGGFDERGFQMLKIIRETRKSNERLTLPQFREMLNEQLQLVLLDEEHAIAALPKLLQTDAAETSAALDVLRQLVGAAGPLSADSERRLARVEKLFGAKPTKSRKANG